MNGFTIFIIILGILAAFIISIYNRLIALRQTRKNAFADIDVQLKLRYNLVPQLVETVKGYAAHEKKLLKILPKPALPLVRQVPDRAATESRQKMPLPVL